MGSRKRVKRRNVRPTPESQSPGEFVQVPPRFRQQAAFAQRLPDSNEGIEQKIVTYENMLHGLRRQEGPLFWGAVQYHLGDALRGRIQGDKAENLERAINAYKSALKVITPTDFPVKWTTTQNGLGIAYSERIRGERARNLERAIGIYAASLKVAEEARLSGQCAMIQYNLGNALCERVLGDPAENLERAISSYRAVLGLVTKADFPGQWAATQHYLGRAYFRRARGHHADNLEQAIVAYAAALEVYTPSDFPVDWVATQIDLGIAYAERIGEGRAENLEKAIAAHAAALEVATQPSMPLQWATAQNNLGNAYTERIQGDRVENLERAIVALNSALEVRTQSEYADDWATTQYNLGNALRQRILGDRGENLEQAIAAYTAALEIRTQADSPVERAMIQNNLGAALHERVLGDRSENLEKAIAAYTAALEVRTQADSPTDWAMTQSNLGNAYSERIQGNRAENLEQAIAAHTAALGVYTRTDFPVEWATTQSNLGATWRERIQGDKAENLERAIGACSAALEVLTQADFRAYWVYAQNNLGGAYAERAHGDREENLKHAITAFTAVIEGASILGIREEERKAAENLGNLYYDKQQWSQAYTAFNTAIAALEAMRTAYFSDATKTRLAEKNAQLYERITSVCLHLAFSRKALEVVEASKGRLFLDQLGTDVFLMPPLPTAQRPLFEREVNLLNELRGLSQAISNNPDEVRRHQFVAQQGEKRSALDEVWARLESHAPDYVAMRRGDPIKYDDIQAMVGSFGAAAALVEFYTLPDKIITFVLRPREQEPTVAQTPVSQDQLLSYVRTYWREVVRYPQHGDIGQRWQELAEPLLTGVLPHLEGAELVYLVPHGLLHYLPLHALQVNGDCLIERFPLAYAPSAAVLNRVIQRTTGKEQTQRPKALVVGNPTEDLHHAESEAQEVAQAFDANPIIGDKATKASIQSELADKNLIHLACHGYFHPTQPLQSGVVFAGGETLTAQEIMGLRLQANLVTLSACETGQSEISTGDELVGLTRTLLYAGASSVLVSLWAVDDESTGQLMTSFYRRLYDDKGRRAKTKTVALQEAMLEVRKQKEHPYYWAPFVLVGDWR